MQCTNSKCDKYFRNSDIEKLVLSDKERTGVYKGLTCPKCNTDILIKQVLTWIPVGVENRDDD